MSAVGGYSEDELTPSGWKQSPTGQLNHKITPCDNEHKTSHKTYLRLCIMVLLHVLGIEPSTYQSKILINRKGFNL